MECDQPNSQPDKPDARYRIWVLRGSAAIGGGATPPEEGARVGSNLENRCSVTLDGVLEGMERAREARKQRGSPW